MNDHIVNVMGGCVVKLHEILTSENSTEMAVSSINQAIIKSNSLRFHHDIHEIFISVFKTDIKGFLIVTMKFQPNLSICDT